MSDESTNENTEIIADDSAVVKTLRNKVKDYEQKVAQFEEARRAAAEEALINSGYPKLVDVFLADSEGFPTPNTVKEFLGNLGLEPKTEVAGAKDEQEQPVPGEVSALGQRVASAAANPTANPSFEQDFANATSPEQIAAVMKKHGMAV